jgi:hypothetical protein
METKELKRAEIKNGKICLEGKVVEADLLELISIRSNRPYYLELEKALQFDYEINKREKEFKERKKDILGVKEEQLELIDGYKPKTANAYVIGKPSPIYNDELRNIMSTNQCVIPILYLRIKEENPSN